MIYLVTGGKGFIGSNLVAHIANITKFVEPEAEIHVLDAETYAAQDPMTDDNRVEYHKCDIRHEREVYQMMNTLKPDAIFHLAAESHVCRSISGPRDFIETNIIGTWNILETMRISDWWRSKPHFKMIHVSTDEVFGDLEPLDASFHEDSHIKPTSPYSASKASSDLLCLSYAHTYKIPVVVTHCSNNYGPNQHDEKLIPKIILSILRKIPLTVYGSGNQRRDWLWVGDHCRGLWQAFKRGETGKRYLFGTDKSISNLEIIRIVHACMVKLGTGLPLEMIHTDDRPTDDLRYQVDYGLAKEHLMWEPTTNLEIGLMNTVRWYTLKETGVLPFECSTDGKSRQVDHHVT